MFVSLFNKVADLLLKRDSSAGVSLWILQKFKNTIFIQHSRRLLPIPISYLYVTSEWGNNKILLQVKFTAFIICSFRNMTLVQIILRKLIPRNDDLFKVYMQLKRNIVKACEAKARTSVQKMKLILHPTYPYN